MACAKALHYPKSMAERSLAIWMHAPSRKGAWIGCALLMVSSLCVGGCDGKGSAEASEEASAESDSEQASASSSSDIQLVKPPFAVRGDVKGLLLVYADKEGLHTAKSRAKIPEPSRRRVRVDSLTLAPEKRLGPDHVYVADLRKAGGQGDYPVRKVRREVYEAWVDRATGDDVQLAQASSEVVIYGASWCGACRAAARFFRGKGIPFVEKDIEKDPGARREMQRKAQQAGVRTSGIPVIDFRGTILPGFDRAAIGRLMGQGSGASPGRRAI